MLLGRSLLAAAGAEYSGSLLPHERAALLRAARGAADGGVDGGGADGAAGGYPADGGAVLRMPASPRECAALLRDELAEGAPRPSGALALWPDGSQAGGLRGANPCPEP